MKIEIEISEKTVRYVIGGATIAYWGIAVEWDSSSLTAVITEREPTKGEGVFKLGPEDWHKALTLMAKTLPHHFANIMRDRYDAETGDVLIQLGCFGELVYG